MALTLGTNIPPFHAAQGNLSYLLDASAQTFSGSLAALSAITAPKVQQCKNLTITPPKEAVEKVDLLGTESTTAGAGVLNTGVFQNAIWDVKTASTGKLSGTMVLTMINDGAVPAFPDFLDVETGTGQAISTTHHRHTFGDSTASQTRVLTGAVFLTLNNAYASGVIAYYAPMVSWGDIKIGSGDGTYEVDFEMESLPKDFAIEVTDKDA